MTPDPGRTLSHYRLLEKIGEGGMGVVFRALDTRLNRHVAIKVLHPLQTSDPKRKKQLIREARTAAALNHPSVCTIHEIGEVPRAHAQPDIPADSPYVVMEFVRGESLHVRLERLGALPLQQLFDLALQVAEGLREAHAHRVIHRDLKPQNLLVTPEGRLKILDFGLAIAMRPALSRRESSDEPTISWDRYEEGKVAGTVPYMSPEQALGKELGTRSDLFSFGSILYEMATGRKPFLDDTNTGILAKILQSEPESILGLRPDLPAGMEQVVLRCLRKDPADRYGDTGELVAALREVQQANASGRLPTVADRVSSDSDAVEHPSEISRNTIAVLPFTVRGSEAFGYLGEGIVDLLSTKLDGAGDLRAVDSHALLCCLEIETLDPGSGREIALRFGAGQFVLGNILEIGGHVHIHAALYDAAEPKIISKSEVEGPATEIFNLVDRLTAELVAGRQGGPEMRLTRIAATTTSSFPALKAYLNGEREMRALRRELAVPAFQTAVKEDPTFGLAWYRLAVASLWSQRPETAWEAARRAVQHSHRLNQRDRSLLEAFNALLRGANDEAERLYRSIVGTFPNDVEAWFQLGELLFHHAPKRGTPLRKSRPIWKRILELAPDHINALVHLGAIAADQKDRDFLKWVIQRIQARSPDADSALWLRALQGIALEDDDIREQAMADLRKASDHCVTWAVRFVGVFLGDPRAARPLARLLTEPVRSKEAQALGQFYLAHLELAGGRWAAAREALAAASALHQPYALEYRALLTSFPLGPVTDSELAEMREEIHRWDAESVEPSPRPSLWLTPHEGLHAPLRNYLAGLLSTRLRDGDTVAESEKCLENWRGPRSLRPVVRGMATSLRAMASWEKGQKAEALRLIERGTMEICFYFSLWSPVYSQVYERFTRAEWLRSLGRLEEALPVYRSFGGNSVLDQQFVAPAHLRLAEIFEDRGEKERAAAHYSRFLELWENCDAELRPLVEEAASHLKSLAPS